VLSNVSPRNVVLQVFAISLFLHITCKSIRELVLVTSCIYCVLSAFIDIGLVVNHLFISWRILLALLVKFVVLKLVIIMLVSSAYRTTSALSLTILVNHLCKVGEAMDQVLIPVGHRALFLPSMKRSQGNYCLELSRTTYRIHFYQNVVYPAMIISMKHKRMNENWSRKVNEHLLKFNKVCKIVSVNALVVELRKLCS
jgi:hypothetical protein